MRVAKSDLQAQLFAFREGLIERLARADAETVRQAERNLKQSGIERNALQVGDAAPDFTLPDQHGKPLRLSDKLRQGPVVVVFFRGGWCPFCSLTLRAYQDVLPALKQSHASLLAITPQPLDGCQTTADRNVLRFALLSDQGNKVADAFGVTHEIAPELRSFYKRMSHELPKVNRTDDWRTPLPATFVIAPDGVVAAAHVAAAVHERMEPSDVIAAVRAIGAVKPALSVPVVSVTA